MSLHSTVGVPYHPAGQTDAFTSWIAVRFANLIHSPKHNKCPQIQTSSGRHPSRSKSATSSERKGKLAETKGSWTAWSQCFYEPAVVLNRSQPVQQPRIRDKIGQRTGKHLKPRCKREISPMPDSDPLPILHYPPICSVISEKTYDYSQKGEKKVLWSCRRWNSLELFPVEAPVVKYTEKKMTYILPRFISTASFSIWNDELSAGEDSPTYFVNR